MELTSVNWAPHFERTGTRTSKCRICAKELNHAGGRPQRHLLENHKDKVERFPDPTPKTVVTASHEAGLEPPTLPPEPDERTREVVHEETLFFATSILKNPNSPENARIAAGRLISDIQHLEDMEQEEDEGEGEQKVVARFEKAIARKTDLEEEFRIALRDPATLQRVERLCAEVRATL